MQSNDTAKIVGFNSSLFMNGGDLIVPSTLDGHRVDIIAKGAINDTNTFTSIKFEEGVRIIEDRAFYRSRCGGTIEFPSSLEKIGSEAFYMNTRLKGITIPPTVKSVGSHAFYLCALCEVVYYDTTTVADNAFEMTKSVTMLHYEGPVQPPTTEPDPPTTEPDPPTTDPVQPPTTDPVQPPTTDPNPTGTPVPLPIDDAAFGEFIDRLYKVALNRDSEPEGKAYWLNAVINQGFTGADCARFFLLDAPEFMNRNLPDDQFVETLYQTFFGRASEADGKAYWLGRLASGASKADLVNDFIESTEWCNICAQYGVRPGALYHKATIPNPKAEKFATRLYTCCLKRDPEADGLQYWALALTNLEASGYQAAKLFFESPEFMGFNTSNEEYLTRLYTTFMGREPESDGFAYWLSQLNGGANRADVLTLFAGSPEFAAICREYGMNVGL
ncbi:MAG: DUF4214 domain-containing protein [Clostridiales bacterium]|nr:DUF4214 domain-containing protein [Clostridiales bacterium]